MGKLTSIFLTLAIFATVAAGIGFFLFYQKQQEALQLDEKSQRLTSRLGEFEDKLKNAETAARDAQIKQQQLERKMQSAPADNDKIAALEQELARATDALKARQSADTTTSEQAKTLQDTIADQQQQIDGLTAQLEEQQQMADTKDAALAEQQTQVAALTAQLEEQQQTADTKDAALTEQQTQVAALTAQLEEQQQQVATLSAENADLKTQAATRAIPTPETAPTEEQPVATPAASDEQQAERDALMASLQEKEAKINDLMQQLTQHQESQKQLAVLQEENQDYQTQLTALQQQNQEARSNAAALEADAQTQEEEYRKLKEAHDQSLASLQAEIANENIEKATIQTRLREELDRSNTEYQTRLDSLAQKKEEEILQLKSVAETYLNLTRDLEQEIKDKTVRIEQIQEKLRVVIVNQILFDSGSAQVSKEGVKVLKTIGNELKRNLEGRQIGIEGHTDNETIGKRLQKQYATNWELSSARASNVLRYLQETSRIPGAKLFAVGYGSHHPVAENATEEGRRLNRRIEIVLTPELERSKKPE